MSHETQNFCDSRIQPCQRVWIRNIRQFAKPRAFANSNHARSSVALFVHGDHQGAIIGRKKECTGGVTEMMFDVGDFLVEAGARLMAKQPEGAKFPSQPSNFTNFSVTIP